MSTNIPVVDGQPVQIRVPFQVLSTRLSLTGLGLMRDFL